MSNLFNVDVKSSGYMQKYLAKIRNAQGLVDVGFLTTETYPNGTPVVYVAYLNEFGQHNPPRPFMKRTFEKLHKSWVGLVRSVLHQKGLNKVSVHQALGQVGSTAVGDIQITIKKWSPTDPRPNKPATIRAKERKANERKPGKNQVANDPYRVLHDTGTMIDSVKSRIRE